MGIIFVAGVHGVGKTTCCKKIAAITGIQYHTASSIIKSEMNLTSLGPSKKVNNVAGNQASLIQGVNRILKSNRGNVILDGHFTVLDTTGQIVAIDYEVFSQLSMHIIVVYNDDPVNIVARLKERDGVILEVQTIAAHQDAELEHAKRIAIGLNIPFYHLKAFDTIGLFKLISN